MDRLGRFFVEYGDYLAGRREDVPILRPLVVDAKTAERIADRIANPRKPNDALRALLAKERTDG